MSLTLYQIDAEIEALENACEDEILTDEETGEIMTIEQALDQMKMLREDKIENVALWIKNLNTEVSAIMNEEVALSKRRKAAENKAERLKAYLMGALTRADGTTDKLRTARVAVSVRKNGPSTVIDDEALVPEEYKRSVTTTTVMKTAIRDKIKAGGVVPGAHLEQTRSVTIK